MPIPENPNPGPKAAPMSRPADGDAETRKIEEKIRAELESLNDERASGRLTDAECEALSWKLKAIMESHAADVSVLKARFEVAKGLVRKESGMLIAQAETEFRRKKERSESLFSLYDNWTSEGDAREEAKVSENDGDDSNDRITGFNRELGNYSIPVAAFEARLRNNDIREVNSAALAEYLAYLGRKNRLGDLRKTLSAGNARGLAMLWGMNAAGKGGDILSSSTNALNRLKTAAGDDFARVVAGVKDAIVIAVSKDAADARFKEAAVAVLRSEGVELGEKDVMRIKPLAEAFSKERTFENLTALLAGMGLGDLDEKKRESLSVKLLEANKNALLENARDLEKRLWERANGADCETMSAQELKLRSLPDGFGGIPLLNLEAREDGKDRIGELEEAARKEGNYGALGFLGNLRALLLKRAEVRVANELARLETAREIAKISSDAGLTGEEKGARFEAIRAGAEGRAEETAAKERGFRLAGRSLGISPKGGFFEASLDPERSSGMEKALAAADADFRKGAGSPNGSAGKAPGNGAAERAGWKENRNGSRTRRTPEYDITVSSDRSTVTVRPAGAENPVEFSGVALLEKWGGDRQAVREDIRSTAELARDTGFLEIPEEFRKEAVRIWNEKAANSGGKYSKISLEDGLSTDGSHLEKKSLVALMELVTGGAFRPESPGTAARTTALRVMMETNPAAVFSHMRGMGIMDGGVPRKSALESLISNALSARNA